MIKDLYTFSKNAWHVRLFKWIYGTNPTQTFNTMCPYFWSMVATFVFFPLILIIKMFGKGGTSLLSKLESYKRDKRDKTIEALIKRCSKKGLTDKEAYNIKESKCWFNYYYYLDSTLEDSIRDKWRSYSRYLHSLKAEKEVKVKQRQQKISEIKESKWYVYLSYLVSFFIISFFIYALYCIFLSIEFSPVDWNLIGRVLVLTLHITITVLLFLALLKYIIIPFFSWLSCRKCVLCQFGLGKYIIAPFVFIWKGILIVGDMVYMTYKKACPRITWKDEE